MRRADRPDALVIIPGRPPMTAVMRQEIQHDCSANEGGSPAIIAYEIASGIMEIATIERIEKFKSKYMM
jgi:hypothetical protein